MAHVVASRWPMQLPPCALGQPRAVSDRCSGHSGARMVRRRVLRARRWPTDRPCRALTGECARSGGGIGRRVRGPDPLLSHRGATPTSADRRSVTSRRDGAHPIVARDGAPARRGRAPRGCGKYSEAAPIALRSPTRPNPSVLHFDQRSSTYRLRSLSRGGIAGVVVPGRGSCPGWSRRGRPSEDPANGVVRSRGSGDSSVSMDNIPLSHQLPPRQKKQRACHVRRCVGIALA